MSFCGALLLVLLFLKVFLFFLFFLSFCGALLLFLLFLKVFLLLLFLLSFYVLTVPLVLKGLLVMLGLLVVGVVWMFGLAVPSSFASLCSYCC